MVILKTTSILGGLKEDMSLHFSITPGNLFTGTIPTYFGKLQKLLGLYLYGNRLLGHIPYSLGNLTQLFELFLSQNKLEGSIPSSFEN
jgi:hypothetical protein